jgi:SH3-like domain-containing protein
MSAPAARARARESYAVQYADPIQVAAGDAVTVDRRDDQFTRWLWCRAEDGRAGWVPETILSATQPGPATVTRAYSATEVPLAAGAMVDLLEQFDGFARVRRTDGREGWVPLAVLELDRA